MSAIMLETYDTQMLDYPSDLDVPMHSSSSDAWFQGEATMEDAPHPELHSQRPTTESTDISVEVDMEPYDHSETTEYEMADDLEVHDMHTNPQDSSDTLDVDVYVASLAQSPALVIHDVDQLPAPPDADIVGDILSGAADAAEGLSHPRLDVNLPSSLPLNHAKTEASREVEATADSLPVLDSKNESSGPSATSDPVREVETFPLGEGVYEHDAGLKEADTLHPAVPPQGSEYDGETLLETESHSDVLSAVQEPTTDSLRSESNTAADAEHHPQPEQQIEASSDDGGDFDSSASAGNPHEISEGVYIDPPPPVLLSLSDQAELSLFNEPTVPGSVDSPRDESQELHTAHVLLQSLPILYYEPLSSVFEALREDDYITSISEYSDGELVLEAYDLQLVISEDNMYAREVSLHDLNVLHDGLGIVGPLRIRLQTIVPRFVVRYHMLQEQVTHLNLGPHGEVFPPTIPEEEHIRHQATNPAQHQSQTQSKTDGQVSDDQSQDLDQAQRHDYEHAAVPESELDRPDITGENAGGLEGTEHDEDETRNIDDEKPDSINPDTIVAPADSDIDETNATELEGNHDPEVNEEDGGYEEEYGDDHGETSSNVDIRVTEEEIPFQTSPEAASTTDTPRQNDSPLPSENNSNQASGSGHYDDAASQGALENEGHEVFASEQDTAVASKSDNSQTSVDNPDIAQGGIATISDPSPIVDGLEAESGEYGEEDWDDDLDGEGDPDTTWEAEHDADAVSNESSITLSSKASKRSFDEVEFDLDDGGGSIPSSSPAITGKRARVE